MSQATGSIGPELSTEGLRDTPIGIGDDDEIFSRNQIQSQGRKDSSSTNQACEGMTQEKILELDYNFRNGNHPPNKTSKNNVVQNIYAKLPLKKKGEQVEQKSYFSNMQPLRVQKKDKTPIRKPSQQNQQMNPILFQAPNINKKINQQQPPSFSNINSSNILAPIQDSAIHHRDQYYQHMKNQMKQ